VVRNIIFDWSGTLVDDLPAVIEFDAGGLVLAAFGRANAGTVRGDTALANRFLNMFHSI
jgi:phosphoglycolate phosphatase-like HAD superfamily hydrolase